ncbi:hybrid sensor histidine kinase/response regulator [Planctomycetes bacterium K23_9]|uniref:Response regulator MprA n=1 Tax=Stieleria marina TaxID=1930275 RepID=A0A517NY92_9BACT|nr:Response regulator MprA [Planctomycetes bacterium K23_9]
MRQRKQRVLVVDDNAVNREICHEILSGDYDVRMSVDGETALIDAEQFRPDIVLLDVMMPGIDGVEVCKRLRQSVCPWVKIIIISAKTAVAHRLEGFDAGADDYMTKPFDEDELLAKVRVHLRLKNVEEIDAAKDQLLNILQHSNRTPLTSILLVSQVLGQADQPPSAEKCRSMALQIENSAVRLLSWLQAGESYVELKSGKTDVQIATVDLSELVNECVERAAGSINVEDSGAPVLEAAIMPQVSANVDDMLLCQMFDVLINHAIAVSQPGRSVRVQLDKTTASGIEFRTTYHSSISPTSAENLFEPFANPDDCFQNKTTGLELAIAKELAELHDALIDATTTKDGSTELRVCIPIAADSPSGNAVEHAGSV